VDATPAQLVLVLVLVLMLCGGTQASQAGQGSHGRPPPNSRGPHASPFSGCTGRATKPLLARLVQEEKETKGRCRPSADKKMKK
jgi:hypothetical protein